MQKLYFKLVAGMGAAIVAGALLAGSTFAADIVIKDNGMGSSNKIVVSNIETCTVVQGSETNVLAAVSASASTGGNSANYNTGGNVTVKSGNASATATMTVTGGSNTATNPCCCEVNPCGCGGTSVPSVVIADNGVFSCNKVKLTNYSSSTVIQGASTNVGANVGAKAKTGKNKAWFNTGGTTNVTSGKATSSATLTVTGGSNTLN